MQSDSTSSKSSRDQRSVLEAFLEILALALGGAVILALGLSARPDPTPMNFWRETVLIGSAAMDDAGWVLPTFAGIILAFYGVIIGRTIAGEDASTVDRTRNKVATGAQGIAAVTIVYIALTLVASFAHPRIAPHLLATFVVGTIVVCLGIGCGVFAFGTAPERDRTARLRKEADDAALRRLRVEISALRSGVVLVVIPIVLAVAPFVVCVLLAWVGNLSGSALFNIFASYILSLIATGVVLGLTYPILLDRGGWISKAISLPLILIPIAFIEIAAFAVASNEAVVGWVVTAEVTLIGAAVWLPLVPALRKHANWTPGAALMFYASRQLQKDSNRQQQVRDQLSVAPQSDGKDK